jgi:hypothetical protein
MAKQLIKEAARMQKLAGIINENEQNILDEGLKDWLVGLGLTAATIAGGIKVYQMDQAQEKDKKAQKEYFDNVLSKVFNKMTDEQKSDLGFNINEKTNKLSIAPTSKITPIEYSKILARYAEEYVETHANEFSVDPQSGLIHWKLEKTSPYK